MRSIIAWKIFRWFLASSLICVSAMMLLPQSQAAELTDLYQAEVDAAQSQTQWQQAAMAAVLVKLTGSEAILTQGAIAAELKNSANYIRQFQQVQVQGRNLMQVQLDQQKITALLQQQQIAIWGSRRPDLLLWLTEKTTEQSKFVLEAEHPLRQALAAQAKQRGLSFVYPMYDVDDLAVVSEAQLVAGDWSGLTIAAARYQPDQVLSLLVEHRVDANGQASLSLIRQQQVEGNLVQQEYIAADWKSVVQQFTQALAAELAAQYAVKVTTMDTGAGQQLQLTIDGVGSLTDLVALQKLFGSMLAVRKFSLLEYQAPTAILQLELAATASDFYRALALESQLKPVVAATASADPAQAAGELSQDPAVAQAPVVEDLTAAEQAMAEALGVENVPATPTIESGIVSTPVTMPLVEATHYQFSRR
jgi:hypothetical protein